MKRMILAGMAGLMAAAALAMAAPSTAEPAGAGEGGGGGAALYATKCLICHQEGGTGTFMLGRRLGKDNALLANRTDLNAAYVRTVVRKGIMSMPRFTKVELSDAQLDEIAAYLTRPAEAR